MILRRLMRNYFSSMDIRSNMVPKASPIQQGPPTFYPPDAVSEGSSPGQDYQSTPQFQGEPDLFSQFVAQNMIPGPADGAIPHLTLNHHYVGPDTHIVQQMDQWFRTMPEQQMMAYQPEWVGEPMLSDSVLQNPLEDPQPMFSEPYGMEGLTLEPDSDLHGAHAEFRQQYGEQTLMPLTSGMSNSNGWENGSSSQH